LAAFLSPLFVDSVLLGPIIILEKGKYKIASIATDSEQTAFLGIFSKHFYLLEYLMANKSVYLH
ncbi:hypothetical protein, partial [Lactobacillus porci]|uniref:hypothetical protein n=1 Tax=Lactobacillus porci TaxID=2012477 RepID=UPI0039952DCC